MLKLIRQSHHSLRLWLAAAMVIFALGSVLEAGHGHGVFVAADDQCALCQHSVALDLPQLPAASTLPPQLLAFAIPALVALFLPAIKTRLTPIRAPPSSLHHC